MAILGIDEVGRGPFAGPLVIGAVILPDWEEDERPEWYYQLNDSKKLSVNKRRNLALHIWDQGVVGLGFVSTGEIDRIGMNEALRLATRRAVKQVQKTGVKFTEIIIDGQENFLEGTALEPYATTVIKGDCLIREISAASIVAKVARDDYMVEIASQYPQYGFERHVGYGTDLHRAMIEKYGLCPEHRRLIKCLKPYAIRDGEDLSGVFCEKARKNTTKIGEKAEAAVAEYLEKDEHEIVARNFKTKSCEIDIVSVCGDKIYFTEVKYRKNGDFGGGLAAVTNTKIKQMKFAATCYMHFRRNNYEPRLAVANVAGENFEVLDWFELDC